MIEREAEYWGSRAEKASREGFSPDLEKPFRKAIVENIWDDSELNSIVRGEYISKILECCSSRPQLDCLELCCGMGTLSLEASRRGARVTGIDVSQRSIEVACRYAGDLGIPRERLQYHVCDLNVVSLPEGKYDVVFAWDGLHHIAEIEHLVGEVWRSLKPGGVFVVHDHAKRDAAFESVSRIALTTALSLIIPSERGLWARLKRLKEGFARKTKSTSTDGQGCLLSPFEDVSGENIVRSISRNFDVLQLVRYLSLPESLYARIGWGQKNPAGTIHLLMSFDRMMSRLHVLHPEYFFIMAVKNVA